MAERKINVLLSTFPGLGLPPTLCMPCSPSSSIADFTSALEDRLPEGVSHTRLILTTSSNKSVKPTSNAAITTLLPAANRDANILSLRLAVPLCGGKGGFGSQLRAAGGKMSSRRKRAQGDENGSSRNLDGRRLRTVNEAKALAEYLAVKPDMEAKDKAARRKRWAQIVEDCDKRVEEERTGKGKARVDEQWADEKEEAESKTRKAIAKAFAEEQMDAMLDSEGSDEASEASGSESAEEDDEAEEAGPSSKEENASPSRNSKPVPTTKRSVFGWDEEEDDEDED